MLGRHESWAVVAVLSVVVLAGCLGTATDPSGTPGGSHGATATTPGTSASADCTGDETAPNFELPDRLPSQAEGFELTASDESVQRGDTVAFALTNVGTDRRHTGTRAQYLLQRRTADGWETVTLFRSGRSGFNATAVPHDPGDGFTWSFTANATGFAGGKYVVCEALGPGTYRFVYGGSPQVGVRFEIS